MSAANPMPTFSPDAVATGTITATDAGTAGTPAGTGVLLTGTPTAASYVALQCPGGDSAWVIQLTGTFGGGTVYFEESIDSTNGADGNWINVNGRQTGVVNTVLSGGTAVAGFFRGNTSGATWLRVRMRGATTPSVAAILRVSDGTGALFLNASIPAGTNTVGSVNLASSQGTATAASGPLTASAADAPGIATTVTTAGQVIANVASAGNATFHLVATAFVGTVVFEASLNGGVNYAPIMAIREDGTGGETGASLNVTAAFIRSYTVGLPGFTHFRVRASAFTSGTLAVYLTQGPFLIETNPSLAASSATIGTVLSRSSDLAVTATSAAAAGAITATLPAPTAGLFHYITSIQITLYAAVARVGAAAPWVVTSTNLPGGPAWSFSTAGAIGTNETQTLTLTAPLKATAAATATTVVAPAATGGIWRLNVTYYVGS